MGNLASGVFSGTYMEHLHLVSEKNGIKITLDFMLTKLQTFGNGDSLW